jgi:hypothetical protein
MCVCSKISNYEIKKHHLKFKKSMRHSSGIEAVNRYFSGSPDRVCAAQGVVSNPPATARHAAHWFDPKTLPSARRHSHDSSD